jgi:multidrug resistance protein, MATE family
VSNTRPTLSEARRIATLAAPLAAVQLAQVAISTTDLILLGWAGGTALAVGALGFTVFNLLRTMGFGLVIGTSNLVAESGGDATPAAHLAGALIIATGAALIAAAIMLMGGGSLAWLGQDPVLATAVGDYLVFLAPGMFPLFWFYAYRGVAVGRRRARPLLAITLLTILVNAVLDYGFLFGKLGLPLLGVPGVAAASSLAYLLQFIVIAVATHRTTRFAPVKQLGASMRRLLALGLPTAGAYGSEAGFTAVLTLMIGTFGAAALTAHAAVNQICYVVFMLSIGLSHATSVGISERVGQHDTAGIRRVGRSGFCLGLAVVAVFSALFLLIPKPLLAAFSMQQASESYPIAGALLIFAAFIQIPDFLQNIGIGAVRAVRRAGQGFWITVASYWLIGAPAAWLLGIRWETGAIGVWLGMGVGLGAAALLMLVTFERGAADLAEP